MSVRKTLAHNTGFNIAGRLWEALSSLILVPYVLATVSRADFGLWGLLGAFSGYVALVDMGFGSGFVKFIAERHARKEREGVASVIVTGTLFYIALGMAVAGAGWACIDPLIGLFHRIGLISDDLLETARTLLQWRLILFAASASVGAFSAVQGGLQRMGVTNLLGFCSSVVKFVATIVFLETGHGIVGLVYAEAMAFVVFATASLALPFWMLPGLRLSFRDIRLDTARCLFSFGWKAQVARIANLVMMETDKVVAGFWGRALEWIALFEVGVTMANKLRQIPVLLLSAIVPAASDLDARGAHDKLQRLYLLSTKYVAAVAVPLTAFTVGAADILMNAWMGAGYEMSAWVLRIIAVGYLANVLPGGGINIALGKGRPDIQMKTGLISTFSNIALTLGLVYAIGFWGIPLGTALSMFLSWGWFLVVMRGVVGVGPAELLRTSILWPTVAAAPGLVICIVADIAMHAVAGRLPNAVALLACAAAFAIAYLIAIRKTPFLDAYDVDFLENTLRMDKVPGFRLWIRPVMQARVRQQGRGW
ncbi:MAG TPA: oligosaccharide flippase family protein [Candidatus Hydrogenedentes bacterium]|nr:oligosaccharide flippase family protein [Candidatus Hydrogenedentota bacterium]HOS01698.1 oligosaccharide flippase family protein [Candidatus Hydrogenedentota bacterium]